MRNSSLIRIYLDLKLSTNDIYLRYKQLLKLLFNSQIYKMIRLLPNGLKNKNEETTIETKIKFKKKKHLLFFFLSIKNC